MFSTIERLDHQGRGIAYINNIVTFIPKTIPGDKVEIKLTKVKKNYQEGKVVKYLERGKSFQEAFCPFYDFCGGCSLQNFSYEEMVSYKLDKVKNIFKRINLDIEPVVIKNETPKNYRNKIELKISNGKVGFFHEKTSRVIEINACEITKNAINRVIPFVKTWQIKEGEVIVRENYNEEILIIIKSNDFPKIDIESLKKQVKLVGIVINDKTFYGESFFFERINGLLFKVSYDSFFQVNNKVASLLFEIVKSHITTNQNVLDLYSGVGTFSLSVAKKSTSVVGIEIIPNAVLNATVNALLNNIENCHFVLNDVALAMKKIKQDFDVWILDPPRRGIDKKTLEVIKENKPRTVIYVSCDPQTLVRDIEDLKDTYSLEHIYILDMFSYTYHVECICVLNRR